MLDFVHITGGLDHRPLPLVCKLQAADTFAGSKFQLVPCQYLLDSICIGLLLFCLHALFAVGFLLNCSADRLQLLPLLDVDLLDVDFILSRRFVVNKGVGNGVVEGEANYLAELDLLLVGTQEHLALR